MHHTDPLFMGRMQRIDPIISYGPHRLPRF